MFKYKKVHALEKILI